MKRLLNILIVIAVLGVFGWLKMPYEQRLSEELHELKLVPPRLTLTDRTRLKQKAFIATYGSLRPTIAAFMSVGTTSYHSNQEWDKIEDAFNEILLLDPYNLYYWDQASWHMASNAAVDKKTDESLTEVGKERVFNEYINKGREILERAVKVNPGNWQFLNLKARLESNRWRNPDYHAAIKTYREILDLPDLEPHVERNTRIAIQFCMQQIPEIHQEAYDHALDLFYRNPYYRVPTIQNEILIGQNHPLNKVTKRLSLREIYGSYEKAYQVLKPKWQRRNSGQKPYGLEEAIKEIEDKLLIPQYERVIPHKPLFIK